MCLAWWPGIMRAVVQQKLCWWNYNGLTEFPCENSTPRAFYSFIACMSHFSSSDPKVVYINMDHLPTPSLSPQQPSEGGKAKSETSRRLELWTQVSCIIVERSTHSTLLSTEPWRGSLKLISLLAKLVLLGQRWATLLDLADLFSAQESCLTTESTKSEVENPFLVAIHFLCEGKPFISFDRQPGVSRRYKSSWGRGFNTIPGSYFATPALSFPTLKF